MNAHFEAEKILKELQFDFATFTLDSFLHFVGETKGREIIATPWDMPPALFGLWISDGDEPKEYIFYHKNASIVHQIHIQLHEVSHFLFGHPTLKINRQFISEVIVGKASLPFAADLPQLRSPKRTDFDTEAETLANLIQERVIQDSQLDRLIHDTSPEEKLANFLRKMSSS